MIGKSIHAMKCIVLVVVCCIAPAAAPAAEETLAGARKLLLAGRYAEAAEMYAAAADRSPAAALGLARCLAAQGKLEEALKRLSAAAGGHAELQAELARLAFERGDYREANSRAQQALRLDHNQLLARWIAAELDRTAGRFDEADRAYQRLVRFHNDHEVKQAESLRWIGLAAAQNARWNRLSDQFHFLVNDLYPDALKLDPAFWPLRHDAGMLFLEKHNRADAAQQFRAALELNPHAAEVHAALARLALENRDLQQAEKSVARALEINPRLLAAWQLKADLLWANFQVPRTLQLLQQKALPLNPVDEQTLGRMAACYVLLDGLPQPGEKTRLAGLFEQVQRQNPHAGEFFFCLGSQLEARNKQPEAERFFREAMRVMPRQIGPQAAIGQLAMRAGREEEARGLLKDAFKADPFNVRVSNLLEVLEVLDGMETLQTGRFTLKYDGRRDRLLARYAGRHLEAVFPALCKQLGYEPAGKSLVEIFNHSRGQGGQQWFSTRMIGLPYLGTVAASTGRMVAMASPYDPQARRQLNWARVLRHELVHVITLQQTNFNIPHWYTEGLAVWSEGFSRPPHWNELLLKRVPHSALFDLDTLNFAFTRPDSTDDWQLAYCQAELYVEYMLSLAGSEGLQKLLGAYRDGLDTPAAIQRVFGRSQAEFETGYRGYLTKLTAALPALKWPATREIAELLQARRQHPEDANAAAELAYAYLRRKAYQEAEELSQTALKQQPKHQLATYVLARLRLRVAGAMEDSDAQRAAVASQQVRKVVAMLEECLDKQSPQPNVLNLLAGLKLKDGQYDQAARLYALGERLDGINPAWTRSLARVYLLAENRPKLCETLARIAQADADDLTVRKKLAEMSLERRDYAAAATWARQALEIDVQEADVHRLLAEALVGRQEYPEAIEEFETAVELSPKQLQTRFALADACVQAKQLQKARRVLEELLKLSPDYPGAELLLESIAESKKP